MATPAKRKKVVKPVAKKAAKKTVKKFARRITKDNDVMPEKGPPKRAVPPSAVSRALTPKAVKIVSKLDDMAYLLENDANALNIVSRQELLHAVDPTLAKTTRFMPQGATNADLWMVRYGDPLVSINAAFELMNMVEPNPQGWAITFSAETKLYVFKLDRLPVAAAPTLPAAITAAALYMQTAKDNGK